VVYTGQLHKQFVFNLRSLSQQNASHTAVTSTGLGDPQGK